jgi:hypothetical protein
MQHTAIIASGLPLIQITFNCVDPQNSVTGLFGPGETTEPDNCAQAFISATVAGVTIQLGQSLDVELDGIVVRATVTANDGGRHVTVEIDVK